MLAGTAKISVTEYDEGGFVVNNIVRDARALCSYRPVQLMLVNDLYRTCAVEWPCSPTSPWYAASNHDTFFNR